MEKDQISRVKGEQTSMHTAEALHIWVIGNVRHDLSMRKSFTEWVWRYLNGWSKLHAVVIGTVQARCHMFRYGDLWLTLRRSRTKKWKSVIVIVFLLFKNQNKKSINLLLSTHYRKIINNTKNWQTSFKNHCCQFTQQEMQKLMSGW